MGAGEIKHVEYVVEETYMPPAPEEYPNPEANAPNDDDDPDAPDSPEAPVTPEAPEADANSLKTVMMTHHKTVDLVYLVWQMKFKSTKSSLTSMYQVLLLVPELI